MRHCPLLQLVIDCSAERAWCTYCGRAEKKVSLGSVTPGPTPSTSPALQRPARTCLDCGGGYVVSGNHQVRCQRCGVERNRVKNAAYQKSFRSRRKEAAIEEDALRGQP